MDLRAFRRTFVVRLLVPVVHARIARTPIRHGRIEPTMSVHTDVQLARHVAAPLALAKEVRLVLVSPTGSLGFVPFICSLWKEDDEATRNGGHPQKRNGQSRGPEGRQEPERGGAPRRVLDTL